MATKAGKVPSRTSPRPPGKPGKGGGLAEGRRRSHLDAAAEARVLGVALGVIRDEGVGALTARRVASEASISVGGVYLLFKSLDGLVARCKESVLADLRDALARSAVEGAGLNVEERLVMLADAYVAFADERPNAWASLFEHAAELVPGSIEERTKPVFLVLEGILADLRGLPAGRRPLMARAIWSAVHGIVYLGRKGNLGPIRREKVPAMVRALVGALVAGLTVGHAKD